MAHSSLLHEGTAALERRLSSLAVRARSSVEQTTLMQESLHSTLPLLLARDAQDAGLAATWKMKAQGARLMANLAYQAAHKGDIVHAGGLHALVAAAAEALPHAFTGEESAMAAADLLLEAAAAIGNLASGADARQLVASGEGGVPDLLARLLRAQDGADQARTPSAEAAASAAAVASEAARALSNLSLCTTTHTHLVESGAPQSVLLLLVRCVSRVRGALPSAPPVTYCCCERCRCLCDDAEAGILPEVEACGEGAGGEASTGVAPAPPTPDAAEDALSSPLLARLLLLTANLLRLREAAPQLVNRMPGLCVRTDAPYRQHASCARAHMYTARVHICAS